MRIKSRGGQAFNVPNSDEGHVFLQLLRKFKNRGWHYRARGRGSRREHGDQSSIAQEHAEWLAVYMSPREGAHEHLPNVAPRLRRPNHWRNGRNPWFVLDSILPMDEPTATSQQNLNITPPEPPQTIGNVAWQREPVTGVVGDQPEVRIAGAVVTPISQTFRVDRHSAPIERGDPVFIDERSGAVYNLLADGTGQNGLGAFGERFFGTAVAASRGTIEMGGGTVMVRLNPDVENPNAAALVEPLRHAPARLDLPDEAVEPPPQPVLAPDVPDETVELTPEEQGVLDTALAGAVYQGHWTEREHKVLDDLINKLVD